MGEDQYSHDYSEQAVERNRYNQICCTNFRKQFGSLFHEMKNFVIFDSRIPQLRVYAKGDLEMCWLYLRARQINSLIYAASLSWRWPCKELGSHWDWGMGRALPALLAKGTFLVGHHPAISPVFTKVLGCAPKPCLVLAQLPSGKHPNSILVLCIICEALPFCASGLGKHW